MELPRGDGTILLVEDDQAVRTVAGRLLRMQVYRVLEARDREEAKRTLDAHEGLVHLLLTEVVLPRDGWAKAGRTGAGEATGDRSVIRLGLH